MYIKVLNVIDERGKADYKGLNIDLFAAGSQLYPKDENVAYVATSEESIPQNNDIEVVTEEQYNQIVEFEKSLPQPKSIDDELEKFKQSQADQDEIIMNLLLGGI